MYFRKLVFFLTKNEEKENKIKNKRYYSFNIVIYEDDERFDNQYASLITLDETIWIRHDQDLTDDGELKKPHYHFLSRLKTACTISALSKKIDVDEHMIEPVKKSFNGSLKYLIHFGYNDKYQYEYSQVQSNSERLKRKFEDLVIKEVPEVDKVIEIQDFIDSHEDYIDISILTRYVQKINKWDAYRRNYSIFRDLVNSHNAKVNAKKYHIDDPYFTCLQKDDLL